MRPALSVFIRKLSTSKLFDSVDDKFLQICEQFLNECFEYNKDEVQVMIFLLIFLMRF
jgi:hypothetical protein